MTEWNDGYVSDIDYTAGFYREMSPAWLGLVAALQGMRVSDMDENFSYCELGCGQGFGTALLAACHPDAQFTGTDFSPSQIENACTLATDAGLKNVDFLEESFAETAAAAKGQKPQYDFVALHGIYSWVSGENRRHLHDFISHAVKPGGLVYVSYNSLPGAAAMIPFQRLMREFAARRPGRSDQAARNGLAFLNQLKDAGAAYLSQTPMTARMLEELPKKNPAYVAHEYLNTHWQPFFHADVAASMQEAGLQWLGTATLMDNFDAFSLPPKLREICGKIKDPLFREMVKDSAINQRFRRDIFIKPDTKAKPDKERRHLMKEITFRALTPRAEMDFTFKTPMGEAKGQEDIYAPIADALCTAPCTIAELHETTGLDKGQIIQACTALTAKGLAHPARANISNTQRQAALNFNRAVSKAVLRGKSYRHLANPMTGNGMAYRDIELAGFAPVSQMKKEEPEALAETLHADFKSAARAIMKDGKPLKDEADSLAVLQGHAEDLLAQRLPQWRDCGMV